VWLRAAERSEAARRSYIAVLPVHPQPRPGEILSSWMVRLALANGYPVHTFYAKVMQCALPIWNRDIDRHPPAALLELLSAQTLQPVSVLRSLTLLDYEGLIYETLPMVGNVRMVLPLGIYHRTRRRAGMQYCPACLGEDALPYFRKRWRLAFHVICERHGCVMHERCPNCRSSVAYHRHGIGRRKDVPLQPLRHCHQCLFDLAHAAQQHVAWPEDASRRRLVKLIRSFEQGHWACGPRTPPCGVPFFAGLDVLVGLISGRHGEALRWYLARKCGLGIAPHAAGTHIEFEHLEVTTRLTLLLYACWLLEKWPKRFVMACHTAGITRAKLAEVPDTLPYWLACVANEHLDRRPYMPSSEEIRAAGVYLCTRQINVTREKLRMVLGLSRDSAVGVWRRWLQMQYAASPQRRSPRCATSPVLAQPTSDE